MTTILNEHKKPSLVRQKLRGNLDNEESRSFLKISRENLSISQSDIEQGFNKSRFRPNKSTALSILAVLFATTCVAIEIWKLQRVLENSREIQLLKRDVDTLKHRFLEEDLLDELKAFEEQLYSEDNNDETRIDDDVDYDSNYEDEYADYSGETENESRSNSSSGSDKDLKETLTALLAAEAKKGEEFEKSVRENRKNIERERLLKEKREHSKRTLDSDSHTTKKRSVQDEDGDLILIPNLHNQTENVESKSVEEQNLRRNDSRDRHSPKKYTKQSVQEPHAYLSSLLDVMKNEHFDSSEVEEVPTIDRKVSLEKLPDRNSQTLKKRKSLQRNELSLRLQRREMTTPRHLRVPKQVFAVHYEADSTLFSSEDEHTGNGRAKHNAGVFKAWRPSSWVQELNTNGQFTLSSDGRVTIHESGLYLAYAQIHYLDEHDENGFHMLVNGRSLFQCMVYSPGFGHKSRSCFSSQVTVLKPGDHIVLRDVGSARYTLFQRDKSFFGLVKLAEIRQQTQRHQLSSSSSSTAL